MQIRGLPENQEYILEVVSTNWRQRAVSTGHRQAAGDLCNVQEGYGIAALRQARAHIGPTDSHVYRQPQHVSYVNYICLIRAGRKESFLVGCMRHELPSHSSWQKEVVKVGESQVRSSRSAGIANSWYSSLQPSKQDGPGVC